MANTDPTGSGASVALDIPPDHFDFLRQIFKAARDGIRADLAEFPDQIREPSRLRREAAAYERLLTALETNEVVPDRDVREVLNVLAGIVDTGNEYERVVREHRALHGLLDQIDPAGESG